MHDDSIGSTVPRRQLGRELRRLRETAGIATETAAQLLEWSRPKLWRIEKGSTALRALDVEAMCRLYDAETEMTRALTSLARETKGKGWWHAYTDVIPAWFDVYLGLEAAADEIHEYAPELVPGLLQTEDYARAVLSLPGGLISASDVERRVQLRMSRQRLLSRTRPAPLRVKFVLNESVLASPLQGASMATQLARIVQASELPNVEIRVLPHSAGPRRAATAGFFAIVIYDDEHEPNVAYSEGLTGSLYLDKRHELDQYNAVFADARDEALNAAASRALIAERAKEYFHG